MKPVTTIAVAVFAIVAFVHVLRLAFGWPVAIGGTAIPMWVSIVATPVAGALSILLAREARAKG